MFVWGYGLGVQMRGPPGLIVCFGPKLRESSLGLVSGSGVCRLYLTGYLTDSLDRVFVAGIRHLGLLAFYRW